MKKHAPSSDSLPDLLRPRRKPLSLWIRVALLLGAALAIVAGLIGWVLPIVTGLPFYIIALLLLALGSDRLRVTVNRLERRLSERRRRGLRRAVGRIRWRWLREQFSPQPGEQESGREERS